MTAKLGALVGIDAFRGGICDSAFGRKCNLGWASAGSCVNVHVKLNFHVGIFSSWLDHARKCPHSGPLPKRERGFVRRGRPSWLLGDQFETAGGLYSRSGCCLAGACLADWVLGHPTPETPSTGVDDP